MLKPVLTAVTAAAVLTTTGAAQSDRPVALEVRAIAMTPTFGIADADRVGADIGAGFGAGLGYSVTPAIRLMADFDAGFHSTEIGDVNTYHYMGKVGFDVYRSERITVTLNAGAGLVSISPDGADALNYFAINAGAKVGVLLAPALELLISPQGDIAFSKDTEVLTDSAWIWPLGVGLRFRF